MGAHVGHSSASQHALLLITDTLLISARCETSDEAGAGGWQVANCAPSPASWQRVHTSGVRRTELIPPSGSLYIASGAHDVTGDNVYHPGVWGECGVSGVSGWWQLSPWSAWALSAGPHCALSPHRTRPLQARQRDARCRRLPERGLGAATLGLPVSQQSSQHAPTTSAVITIQERLSRWSRWSGTWWTPSHTPPGGPGPGSRRH